MSITQTEGMYPLFDRGGPPTRATHYCAGCGHGILHKLIAEALHDLGLQDRTVIINPIGCAVFGYYYWDVGNVGAAHGRAPAIATAISRANRDAVLIAYQGDGDLGAIGFNCAFQAAGRGERMVTFFVNNATYGMTGGQMAPTTLPGQRTATSPLGRSLLNDGYPLHVCETLNQLTAPVYIERCSLADVRHVMQARRAVRKALEIQRDGKGYAFVEFLSPCPTNIGGDALTSAKFVAEELEKEFPLGCLRDHTAEATPRPPAAEPRGAAAYFTAERDGAADARLEPTAPELRFKFAGFGGQGILSLGLCVAEAGRFAGKFTTWFPSYGPEQRGGAASCAVVMAGQPVGSPAVEEADVLICMNAPSVERFAGHVKPGGLLIVDAGVPAGQLPALPHARVLTVPAIEIATKLEQPRAANAVMLAALAWSDRVAGVPVAAMVQALEASFRKKPALVAVNRAVFDAGLAWCREHLAS